MAGYGRVRLDVCCNDPDDGSFAGRAAGLHLVDILELSACNMLGPVFREVGEGIQISRRRFPILRSKEWYGNWAWNAYWLEAEVAAQLLAYVHGQGTFSVDGAEARLFTRWKCTIPFNANDRDVLARKARKAMIAANPEVLHV